MIDLLFRSTTRKDFEAMARTAGFLNADNSPVLSVDIDPTPGSPEYETGIPIVDAPASVGEDQEQIPAVLKSGWHCNVRLSGERELQEIDGLPQEDEDGNLLPAAERTHFGIEFSENGTVTADGATEGIQYANVALINELTVASPQRMWQ
jgi:thiamine pyrophosphate-dependent acetolactate synthase large subunit-like protein